MALIDYCYPYSIPEWEDPPAMHEYCGPYSPFNQNEIDEWIIVLDAKEFPKEQGADKAEELTLKERFLVQAKKLRRETQHFSSPGQRMMHPSYQAILGMGNEHPREIIRLMIEDMQQHRTPWFWALSYLAQDNPISQSDAGKTDKMIKAWVDWEKASRSI